MKSGFLSQFPLLRNRLKGMNGGIPVIMSLDQVCLGVWACVTEVDTAPQLRLRLRDFGLVPGTRVRRRYCSPGADVTAIELRGSVIALRRSDLLHIRVCV